VRLLATLEKIPLMHLPALPNYGSAGKSSDCRCLSHSAFLLTYIGDIRYERQKSC
jgi:histidine ammonia-lyase